MSDLLFWSYVILDVRKPKLIIDQTVFFFFNGQLSYFPKPSSE